MRFELVGVRSFLFYLGLFLLGVLTAFSAPTPTGAKVKDVPLGATRDEVIEKMGQPLSHAGFGSREIFTYPNKVRVVLEDGHVTGAENLLLSIPTATPTPTESPVESEAPVATPTPAITPMTTPVSAAPAAIRPTVATNSPPSPPPKKVVVAEVAKPKPTVSAAEEVAELGVPVGPDMNAVTALATKMAAQVSPTPAGPPKTASAMLAAQFRPRSLFDSSELPLPGKAMLLVFHFAITLAALYFAFRIYEMNTLTSGILAIGAIDVILHGAFEALGPYTSGLSTMSAVENGIPAVVMIFTVCHFSFTKNIPMSVKIAAGVKLAVFFVKLIVTAALLDFVFPAQ